jgi:tetratricopeptide (TPR) repeat protein
LQKQVEYVTDRIERNPQKPSAYNKRGQCYSYLKCYEEALMDFTKAIELDSGFTEAYFNRANVYDALNQPELAAADRAEFKEITGEDAE